MNFQTVFCDLRSLKTAILCKHKTGSKSTRKEDLLAQVKV